MSSQSNPQNILDKFNKGFDSLLSREQKILFFGVPVTLIVVMYLLIIEPQIKQNSKLIQDRIKIEQQLELAQQSTRELIAQAEIAPDQSIKQQIDSVEKQLTKLDDEFNQQLGQLVSPQGMSSLLQDLFVKAERFEPTEIFSTNDGLDNNNIYQHGIEITFTGDFFATRDFLVSAENIGWKLYWEGLTYQGETHPDATTTLSLFTLSTSEAFIGAN